MIRSVRVGRWGLWLAMSVLARPLVVLAVVVGGIAAVVALQVLGPPEGVGPLPFLVVAGLSPVLGVTPMPGIALDPQRQADLADVVRQTAKASGFGGILLVRIVPQPNAALAMTTVDRRRAAVLLIGWPLLTRLERAELAAVVAHELAHTRALNDRGLTRLMAAYGSLAASLDRTVHAPRSLVRPLLRRCQMLAHEIEYEADVVSARIVGTRAVREALAQTDVLAGTYDLLVESWCDALEGEEPVDALLEFTAALDDPLVARRVQVQMQSAPEVRDPDHRDSHPDLTRRLAALPDENGILVLQPGPVDLVDREPLAEALCGQGGPDTVRVADQEPGWLDRPPDVLVAQLRTATSGATDREALTRLRDAVSDGSWPDLMTDLVDAPATWTHDERRRQALLPLAGGLASILVPGLLANGWTPSNRWLAGVLRSPAGEDVDLASTIAVALSEGDAGSVTALMDEAGVA